MSEDLFVVRNTERQLIQRAASTLFWQPESGVILSGIVFAFIGIAVVAASGTSPLSFVVLIVMVALELWMLNLRDLFLVIVKRLHLHSGRILRVQGCLAGSFSGMLGVVCVYSTSVHEVTFERLAEGLAKLGQPNLKDFDDDIYRAYLATARAMIRAALVEEKELRRQEAAATDECRQLKVRDLRQMQKGYE